MTKTIKRGSKRSRTSGMSRGEREVAVAEFLQAQGGPLKAEKVEVRSRYGSVVSYGAMELPPSCLNRVPEVLPAPDQVWADLDFIPRVGAGKTGAICFPVYSERLSSTDYMCLGEEEQLRCVPSVTPLSYLYCPRDHVDLVAEDGSTRENFYLANSVRWALPNEPPNCRLMRDWETEQDEATESCLLVSICKTQNGSEWKLDREYAQRMLSGADDSDYGEESVEVEDEPAVKRETRSNSTLAVSSFQSDVLRHLEDFGKFQSEALEAFDLLNQRIESLSTVLLEMADKQPKDMLKLMTRLLKSARKSRRSSSHAPETATEVASVASEEEMQDEVEEQP